MGGVGRRRKRGDVMNSTGERRGRISFGGRSVLGKESRKVGKFIIFSSKGGR